MKLFIVRCFAIAVVGAAAFAPQALADGSRGLTRAPVEDEGIPQPVTWALMMAGIGGLGVMMRRRSMLEGFDVF